MTIHWSLLVPGLLLLWFPADRLLSRAVQLRSFDCFQSLERSRRHRPWWWVPVLWLDPGRGFLGSWLLMRAFALEEAPGFSFVPVLPYGMAVGVLILAVLIQTFSRREEGVLLAPIGFVVGLVLAITSWPVAAVGLTMGLVGLFAFREFHAFFAVSLVAVAVLGFAFEVPPMWLLPAIGALALPVAAGVMTGRTLELPTRDASSPRGDAILPARVDPEAASHSDERR
jgi:hypothetical protein